MTLCLWAFGTTAFRVNELACILPEDIVLDTEVPYINIEHNHIRKVKK